MTAAVIVSGGIGFMAGNKLGGNEPFNGKREQVGNFQNMRGTGQVGSAIPGGKGMNGGMISGEVLSIDGQSITIKVQNEGSKIILVPEGAKVMKSVSVDKSDIKQGENIIVTGKTNSDGSVSAESIQLRAPVK